MMRMVSYALAGRWLLSAVLVGTVAPVAALAGVAAVESSRLQADADGLLKNVEEMMAHELTEQQLRHVLDSAVSFVKSL